MKTPKQKELINTFLSQVGQPLEPLYREIFECLSEHGYNPHKQRSYIIFKHTKHNKQIAKTGIRINKDKAPFFKLRFSACRGYSQRFASIVKDILTKVDDRPGCIFASCDYCGGEPESHVYKYEDKYHCGAVAFEIPNISADDIAEIKKLICENHKYLMKNQAGIEI